MPSVVSKSLPVVSTTNVPLVAALSSYQREEPPTVLSLLGSPESVVELKLLMICEPNPPADTEGKPLEPVFLRMEEAAASLLNKSCSLSNECAVESELISSTACVLITNCPLGC